MENIEAVCIKILSQKGGENPLTSLLVEINKIQYVLNLWTPWNEIGDYIQPYTKIRAFNVDKIKNSDSIYYSAGKKAIVVVDPDILINASTIGNISYCPRSYYISEKMGDTLSPLSAIKGTIVHVALSTAIASGNSPTEVLSDVIDYYSIQFEQLGYSRENIETEVYKMVEALDQFIKTLPTETIPESLFFSPYLGIRGRIDVLAERIYELKTAKLGTDDDARFSDMMQVTLYSFGLTDMKESIAQTDGTVLYVGSETLQPKEVNISWGILRYAIQMRNIAYRISFLDYIPPILGENQSRKCSKCSVQVMCSLFCAGLNQFRNCEICNHSHFCSKTVLSEKEQEYFNKYSYLLSQERLETNRNLADLWNLSLEERVEKGKTIVNLVLKNEILENGIRTLVFSCNNQSEIREGDVIILSDGEVISNPISTGTVTNITSTSIEIETKAHPEKVSVIDLYSIDVGFNRQQRGLFNFIFKSNNFKDIILGHKPPVIKKVKGNFVPNNSSQNEAIQKILGTENYLLIQGPAGTGKTHVIAKSAILLADKKEKVLLTAYTNRAVDNMCKYLLENGYQNFVRLGSTHATQRKIRKYTLFSILKKNKNKKVLDLLDEYQIIVATTSTISSPVYSNLGIQTVIVDEASQMTETTLLSALIEGKKFILVGDHKQLPPVIQSVLCKNEGFDISLFEKLAKSNPQFVHLLTIQFRMNEKIMEFSNKKFYENKLECFDNLIALQNLYDLGNFAGDFQQFENKAIYDPKMPLVYVQVNGKFNPEKKLNAMEAEIVATIAKNFLRLGISTEQIGVIAPYRGQVGEIRRYIPGVSVDTVDRFQGSDREIIILSLTETNIHGFKGFSDERRLNVAITRAKKKLVVVGNPNLTEGELGEYISYLRDNVENVQVKEIEEREELIEKQIRTVIVADSISKVASFFKKVKAKGKELYKSKEEINKCPICFQQVYENAIQCPICEKLYHYTHLIQWIKEKGRCPYCKTSLSIYSVYAEE
ncbi:MAG: AAA family ATPase [Candidatus Heimdallarchaeum aukensis]|uniref:DNA helicase n=1 Tax=Candidatus Heimdallarchaeum aukensis TaxID=2876573 RepID=A0A9Y1BIL7_9ARCH|nr:MAG: AAA family ATPase [Candidatus Heimdallarchaeum aukensis]